MRNGNVGDGKKRVFGNDTIYNDNNDVDSSLSALKDRWIYLEVPIAKERWRKANIDLEIIERYLSKRFTCIVYHIKRIQILYDEQSDV